MADGSSDSLAPVQQYHLTGSSSQLWSLLQVGPGLTFEIVNAHSNRCLWTDGVAGDQLLQAPCTGSKFVLWQTSMPDGLIPQTFTNPASGLVMDIQGSRGDDRAPVIGWTYTGNSNQLFELMS